MTDTQLLDWLESTAGLEIYQDGSEWTRPDGSKFIARFRLAANGTSFGPHPTLRETIIYAMSED